MCNLIELIFLNLNSNCIRIVEKVYQLTKIKHLYLEINIIIKIINPNLNIPIKI